MAYMGRNVGNVAGARGLGPVGTCYCPDCNVEAPHYIGQPCPFQKCPQCGKGMRRKAII